MRSWRFASWRTHSQRRFGKFKLIAESKKIISIITKETNALLKKLAWFVLARLPPSRPLIYFGIPLPLSRL